MGGVTVFEMCLSLPWHKPILAKAVYLRNAVIFQYNRLEAEQPPTQTSFSPSRTVCLVLSLSGGPTSVEGSTALVQAWSRVWTLSSLLSLALSAPSSLSLSQAQALARARRGGNFTEPGLKNGLNSTDSAKLRRGQALAKGQP